jgi:glycosyltransferase involved in cell wall biosynthesis
MKLLVALEHHFVRTSDGIYTDLAFAYDYWQEYLGIFDSVLVVARIEESNKEPVGLKKANGEGVEFFALPDHRGGRSFIKNFPKVFWLAGKATKQADYFLLRAGKIGCMVWLWLILRRKKYAMECMGHVKEGVATERPKTLFYKTLSSVTHYLCRIQVRFAQCSSYTSHFLRKSYPCKKRKLEFVFSGVRLTDDVITSPRQKESFTTEPFRIVSIGRVELQKGHQWLVRAAGQLAQKNDLSSWSLDIVGPGSQIPTLKRLTKELQIEDKVKIVGGVEWGTELFGYIDKAQLFMLPSLTEGMPRSLIEAMARGIPAIGSNTGGIPELLCEEALVPVDNVSALTDKIVEFMSNPDLLVRMSNYNFQKAQDYRIEKTKSEKLAFWNYIKDNT